MSNDDNCLEWVRENIQLDKNNNATFVECLRWMRIPRQVSDEQNKDNKIDKQHNIDSQLKLLQTATEKAGNFTKPKEYLEKLNERTKKIAGEGNTFDAKCSWRMRVGGQRGPESILLPAFDALGIPYIPSSTLRGVARNQALWELKDETEVAKYFGSLDADNSDRMGKVIFLDAYPSAKQWSNSNLAMDIANNIWNWKDGNSIEYKPNPNTFISLREATFVIGLRPTIRCEADRFKKVVTWLKKGLQSGVGSQINSGYGEMVITKEKPDLVSAFLEIDFTLQSQFIHSYKRFQKLEQPYKQKDGRTQTDSNGVPQSDTLAEPEVRPIAFKSMLRYWFRTIAFGLLSSQDVKYWESKLFGSIDSQTKAYGWVKFQISATNKVAREQNKDKPCEIQRGKLSLYLSREIPEDNKETVKKLFKSLVWLMFHLGSVGQGARRPLYQRNSNPWYRGSKLRATNNIFEPTPATCEDFKVRFQAELTSFYEQLTTLTGQTINLSSPINSRAKEAIDCNCKIFVCQGKEESRKSYALATLHLEKFNPLKESLNKKTGKKELKKQYNPELCGDTGKQSPVWIAGLDNYQVVTVFGATTGRRQEFVNALTNATNSGNCLQMFPINNTRTL
jgi:CRISPR-associated protein Cmr6